MSNSMLLSTFLHLKGIGEKTEKSLWRKGVLTWDDYFCQTNQTLLLPGLAPPSPLSLSMAAYKAGDVAFFANKLPSSALYRIALSYPKDTLFLDIETTGLSLYYDIVTIVGWSIGSTYDIHINGQDDTKFRESLKLAKIIITFNGTMFDLKFLEKYYSGIRIPPVHVDLRFLAKRVGLTGGQKIIEKVIGYQRPKDIEGMLGEAAPILWHKYRRGENKALKRLIEYNHEDIEGMKHIFDHCIDRLFENNSIPSQIKPSARFSDFASSIKWSSARKPMSSGISIPTFSGPSKPLIDYTQLNSIYPIDDFVVIGIDLVSSEKRESGCCQLSGNRAKTCRLKSDEEIIEWALKASANLISIDSPLSIPAGRTSFFDDDPKRNFGIMRECERILKKRGVNVYPCLIPSMQKLTRRGMTMAEKFRQLGIPVIESYPGAAQDIMSIPRKQAGLKYLIEGLHNFGITGDFVKGNASHDELDAITSAIVGLFFWTGMFEGLGNPLEEFLIIPDLNGDSASWLNRNIIGIRNNFDFDKNTKQHTKYSDFAIVDWNSLENITKNRNDLFTRSNSLAKEMGINIDLQRKWNGKEFLHKYKTFKTVVIKGLEHNDDLALMIETFGPSFDIMQSLSNNK